MEGINEEFSSWKIVFIQRTCAILSLSKVFLKGVLEKNPSFSKFPKEHKFIIKLI